jgi:hypothetical protein
MTSFGYNVLGFGSSASTASFDTLMQIITDASLTTNLQFVLDAGDSNSYSSGQKWLDVSGNGHDFFLGENEDEATNDPTFNGTAGDLSDNEYFSFDGGDNFRYDTSNAAFMERLHKNGAKFTMLCVDFHVDDSEHWVMSTYNGGLSISGITWTDAAAKQRLYSNGDSSAPNDNALIVDNAHSTGAWNVRAITADDAAATGFFFINGNFDQDAGSDTISPTMNGTSAAAGTFRIGSTMSGGTDSPNTPYPSGSRIAAFALWEGTTLTKANLDTIYAGLGPRFGLS